MEKGGEIRKKGDGGRHRDMHRMCRNIYIETADCHTWSGGGGGERDVFVPMQSVT